MSLDMSVIKKRLKEAVNGDVQDMIAEKLHVSQSTVSKILSGSQQPTTEVLFNISETYGVSIDWLLGRSDIKQIETAAELSYAEAIQDILELSKKGAVEFIDFKNGKGSNVKALVVKDPLMLRLLTTGTNLQKADDISCESWIQDRLGLFRGKPVFWSETWDNEGIDYLMSEARNEGHLLEVYKEGRKVEDEYNEITRPDPGPFDE